MRAWGQTLVERSREYRPSTGETLPTSYIIDCEKCGSHSFNDGSVPCPPADGRARLAKLRKMADAGTKHERSRAQIVYQSKKRKLKNIAANSPDENVGEKSRLALDADQENQKSEKQ